MSGPKRNPDKLNTIGVVVVGICGAVLVYVSIVALQAFYMNDTSSVQSKADYEGMDVTAKGKKADELRNISEVASNGNGSFRMKIDDAMKGVVEAAKSDPSHLTGSKLPPSTKESIPPAFGRPKLGGEAAPTSPAAPAGEGSAAAPAGAGSAAAPAGAGSAAPAGAGSAAPAGAGSAAPAAGATGTGVILTPTGAGTGPAAGASPSRDNAAPGAGSGQPARPRTP
jgi:hypothetical protein